jgi:hypothetical protein
LNSHQLTHHPEIITIEGESYRKREAEQSQKAKQAQKPPPTKAQGVTSRSRPISVGPDSRGFT